MIRSFSDDLRSRVLAASRGGMSARSAAAQFGIGISTAIAWIASARAGRLSPAKQGRRGGSRLDAHEDFIVGMIEEAKDITLNERRRIPGLCATGSHSNLGTGRHRHHGQSART